MESFHQGSYPKVPVPMVLGFSGSPRKGGNSDVLLTHILDSVRRKGISAENILLREHQIEPCIGCEKCRKDKICTGLDDDMSALYPKIITAQGLVLVTPVHNYNVTAWIKAFIDRLYCFYDFTCDRPRKWTSRLAHQNRKALIAAVCEQDSMKDMGITLDAMRLPLEALGFEIIGELPVLSVFDKGKILDKPMVLKKAADLGSALAEALLR